MNSNEEIFSLTVICQDESQILSFKNNELPSLMALLSDRLGIPGFGICSGMGSCGTCTVRLRYGATSAGMFVQSCDVRLNDGLNNATIIIPQQF